MRVLLVRSRREAASGGADGARDFVNGGAQIGGGVALALIPTQSERDAVYP